MNRCFYCDKGTVFGRSHTHHRGVAGGRWKKRAIKTNRMFKANLQRVSILLEGKKIQIKLCTKCLKRIKKDTAEGVKPFLTLSNIPSSPKTPLKEENQAVAATA